MTREEAIINLKLSQNRIGGIKKEEWNALQMAIEALTNVQNMHFGDVISRADAIEAVERIGSLDTDADREYARSIIDALPSAEAVQGWRFGKPTEQGEYMVTVDSMRHGMVELMYYGKPIMPNCKVRGKCWYRSDDEWGDVVYDDKDILAWMPLPKPYKGSDTE